jgi:hypothetical protein
MSIDVIERAVRLARELGSFSDGYKRWADHWLDGSDRSTGSARTARRSVAQWDGFADFWTVRCMENAADAAEQRSHGEGAGLAWLLTSANESAEAAIRDAGFVANPPPQPDRPYREPDLVLDDWNRDSGGAKRGRSYDLREV